MKIMDERIIHMKNNIYSKGFIIGIYGLWVLVAYHGLIMREPITSFLDIFLLTVGLSAGVVISLARMGLFHKEEKDAVPMKRKIVNEVVFFAVYMVLFPFITGLKKPVDLFIAFGIMVLFRYTPTALKLLSYHQAEKQLEE